MFPIAALNEKRKIRSREINEKPKKKYSGIDEPFTVLVLLLLLIGLVCLYSASYVVALDDEGDSLAYIRRQGFFAAVGVAVMFLVAFTFDYHKLHYLAIPMMGLSFLLLLSIKIGALAMLIGSILGILLGIAAALHHNGFLDTLCSVLAILGVSVPSYVFALLLAYFIGFKLQWTPILYNANRQAASLISRVFSIFIAFSKS